MNKPDVLRVTNDQNPAIAPAMRDKKIGDEVTFEVKARLKGSDVEGYDFTVLAVIPEGFEVDEDKEPDAIPMAPAVSDAPNMTPQAAMVTPKS